MKIRTFRLGAASPDNLLAASLGKNELTALHLSKRQGWLWRRLAGERVEISGQARAYLAGIKEI